MKKLGFTFIAVSLVFVLLSTIYPYSKAFYVVNGLAFLILLSGIWAINLHYAPEEKGMPKYDVPPPPPIKKKDRKFILSGKANYDFRFWHFDKKEKYSEEFCVFNVLSVTCQNALIIEWFREVHNLHSYIERYDDGSFDYVITSDLFTEVVNYNDGPFKTHLDAQNKSIETMVSKIYKNDFPDFPQSEPSPPKMPKDRIG